MQLKLPTIDVRLVSGVTFVCCGCGTWFGAVAVALLALEAIRLFVLLI